MTSGSDAVINIYVEQDYDDDISSITSCDSLYSDFSPEMSLSLPLELMNKHHASKRSLEEATPPLLSKNKRQKTGPVRTSFVYSRDEITGMLNAIEKVRPRNIESWTLVQVIHESFWPQNRRTVDSLKRKFRELYNYKNIQQHPRASALVIIRAKCIHNSILLESKGDPYNLLHVVKPQGRVKYSAPKLKPIHVPCPLYEPIPMVIEVPSIHSVDHSNQEENQPDTLGTTYLGKFRRAVTTPPLVVD